MYVNNFWVSDVAFVIKEVSASDCFLIYLALSIWPSMQLFHFSFYTLSNQDYLLKDASKSRKKCTVSWKLNPNTYPGLENHINLNSYNLKAWNREILTCQALMTWLNTGILVCKLQLIYFQRNTLINWHACHFMHYSFAIWILE